MCLEQLPPRFCTDMKKTKAEVKISKVMREYKAGTLHSGKGGAVVKNPKQAIAIAISESKRKKK
jgi:ribosomal protein L21E